MEKKLLAANNQALLNLLKTISDTEILISDLMDGFGVEEITNLIALGQDISPLLKDATIIIPQWTQLDDAARSELVAFVNTNCKFPENVAIEQWTQKVLSAAVLLSKIYQVFA